MPIKRSHWWQRDSLSKVSIEPQWPWQMRALLVLGVLLLCLASSWFAWRLGRAGGAGAAGPGVAQGADPRLDQLQREREKLQTDANAAESKFNIERAAQQNLLKQVKTLETENVRLKEDLAFFESLMPAEGGPRGLAIRRLVIDSPAPGQVRYRVLVMQGGKGDVEFNGTLALAVSGLQGGKNVTLMFPDPKALPAAASVPGVDSYKISFKHYQRLEGILTMPDGLQVKSVQARVLERGQVRAQQSANLQG
jgi:hypothetical protein